MIPVVANFPKNYRGGLNMLFAAREALEALGLNASFLEVKTAVLTKYGPLGVEGIKNLPSFRSAVGYQRKKLRHEQSKIPSLPHQTVIELNPVVMSESSVTFLDLLAVKDRYVEIAAALKIVAEYVKKVGSMDKLTATMDAFAHLKTVTT